MWPWLLCGSTGLRNTGKTSRGRGPVCIFAGCIQFKVRDKRGGRDVPITAELVGATSSI